MDQPANPTDAATNGAQPEAPRDAELRRLVDELKRIQDELAARDKKLDDVLRAFAAAKNEHAEFRTRLQRERDRLIDLERGRVAMAFLEAADELDRAIKAAGDDASPLAQGVRLTREAMARKMAEMGIEPIALLGRPFDPNVSEAVDLVQVDDPARDGIVVEELTRGYQLGDKLLRPARVRVGRHVATTSTAPSA